MKPPAFKTSVLRCGSNLKYLLILNGCLLYTKWDFKNVWFCVMKQEKLIIQILNIILLTESELVGNGRFIRNKKM